MTETEEQQRLDNQVKYYGGRAVTHLVALNLEIHEAGKAGVDLGAVSELDIPSLLASVRDVTGLFAPADEKNPIRDVKTTVYQRQ